MSSLIKEDSLNALQIRDSLRLWIAGNTNMQDSDIFINELGFYNKIPDRTVDNAFRADLVLATDALVGFEIKSEKDSLKRWEAQKIAYTNVFDEVWLCAHHKHLDKAIATTPDHIGLIAVNNSNALEVVRRSVVGHGMNNAYDLSSMLWRDELDELAALHGIKWKSRTTKRQAREIVMTELAIDDVRRFLIKRLKIRKNENIRDSD